MCFSFSYIFFNIPLWITIIITTIASVITILHVRKTENKVKKYIAQSVITQQENSNNATNNNDSNSNSMLSSLCCCFSGKKKKSSYSSRVACQSFCYVMAFFISLGPLSIASIMNTSGKKLPFTLLFLISLCTPLQGFLNLLVYVRPRLGKYWRSIRVCFVGRLPSLPSFTLGPRTERNVVAY